MDSELVKVDRKLFITCRLCIQEMGEYQITPQVIYLIKFCFDIDVDPFDGLPQLICDTCKTVLSEYYTKKRIFVGKQNALKATMEVRKDIAESAQKASEADKAEPQQDTVSSSQQNETTEITKPPSKAKKRRVRVITSSSSSAEDEECARSVSPLVIKKPKKLKRISNPAPEWVEYYNKRFACRFCKKILKMKANIKKHMTKHTNIISQYSDILKRPLLVTLHKLDNQPNITGTHTATMLSRRKIIATSENAENYSTVYLLKEEIDKPSEDDKSDSDDLCGKNRKRPRLLSHSSTDTVVLDENKNTLTSDNETNTKDNGKDGDLECIYLDDSSNGSNENASSEGNYKIKSDDYKVIQNLISRCQTKYIQEHESFQSDLNQMTSKDFSSIKHKIINMGRKLINGPGVSSTGILRYMEYSNLEIKWMASKDLTYVRVMPFLKSKECNAKNNLKHTGWKDVTEAPKNQEKLFKMIDQKVKPKPKRAKSTVSQEGVEQINAIIQNNIAPNRTVESDKKLLNANPVANPKQLPKKNGIETKPVNASTSNAFYVEIPIEIFSQPEEPPTCMPIITSTTSLAASTGENNEAAIVTATETHSANENNFQVEKSTPRIKVKPVSELMSERALQSLGQQQNVDPPSVWNQNVSSPANCNMMPMRVSSEPCKMISGPKLPESLPQRGFLILNTVELPNTKTDSPFNYVKKLLQMHDITLLDFSVPLPADLPCLIKFKLQFYRDNLDKPVALCLSVYCAGNKIFLGVCDTISAGCIELNKLSPNWQWEIFKIYTTNEDVIKKIKQNAEKISQEVFRITNSFLCILKSIEYKTEI